MDEDDRSFFPMKIDNISTSIDSLCGDTAISDSSSSEISHDNLRYQDLSYLSYCHDVENNYNNAIANRKNSAHQYFWQDFV